MSLDGRDIVSIGDFTVDELSGLFDIAKEMVPVARGEQRRTPLEGRVVAQLFFEPSTRTRLSFEAATKRLGGRVLELGAKETSSIAKGETLSDTIRVVDNYADLLVLRHSSEGAARLAAERAEAPVINAGDGAGEHPTQTMLDLFTILTEAGSIERSHVAMVGDLRYGRTVHSLAKALTGYGSEMSFVSPEALTLPDDLRRRLIDDGADIHETTELDDVVADADVLYVTRIQRERFGDEAEYRKVQGSYRITPEILADAKPDCKVMHPLPRIDEIHPSVDDTSHAIYFRQAFNGLPVRMALIADVLGVS